MVLDMMKVLVMAAALAGLGLSGSGQPRPGIVEEPCSAATSGPTAIEIAFAEWMLQTDPTLPPPATVNLDHEKTVAQERAAHDWANLCRWRSANRAIADGTAPHPAVVFIGNSITENWVRADIALFSGDRAGRGVAGQTSAQILVRFPEDVVALGPKVVHIMAGTNDIAGNGGPATLAQVESRIAMMAEAARAHGIAVVIGSVPPAADFFWNPGLEPARHIAALNRWLKGYAARQGFFYVDYHAALADPQTGGIRAGLSNDGVHPNRNGYAVMKPLAERAIGEALAMRAKP